MLNLRDVGPGRLAMQEGVIFLTYSLLVSGSGSAGFSGRLRQVVNWCGGASFDGVLVFDECHKAKNLSVEEKSQTSSKAATHVRELQARLPLARVVYVSATGASELSQIMYMDRLGLWGPGTPFPSPKNFLLEVR